MHSEQKAITKNDWIGLRFSISYDSLVSISCQRVIVRVVMGFLVS